MDNKRRYYVELKGILHTLSNDMIEFNHKLGNKKYNLLIKAKGPKYMESKNPALTDNVMETMSNLANYKGRIDSASCVLKKLDSRELEFKYERLKTQNKFLWMGYWVAVAVVTVLSFMLAKCLA